MHFSPYFRCLCRCPSGAAPAPLSANHHRQEGRGRRPQHGRLCGSTAPPRRLGVGLFASGGRLGHRCVYLFDLIDSYRSGLSIRSVDRLLSTGGTVNAIRSRTLVLPIRNSISAALQARGLIRLPASKNVWCTRYSGVPQIKTNYMTERSRNWSRRLEKLPVSCPCFMGFLPIWVGWGEMG